MIGSNSVRGWGTFTVAVIVAGLVSRLVRTGLVVFDKYLGDALYAVMLYGLVRMWVGRGRALIVAAVGMVGIEVFQLTGIPAGMFASEWLMVRVVGRLLGLEFGWLDLLAYGVGIAIVYVVDGERFCDAE